MKRFFPVLGLALMLAAAALSGCSPTTTEPESGLNQTATGTGVPPTLTIPAPEGTGSDGSDASPGEPAELPTATPETSPADPALSALDGVYLRQLNDGIFRLDESGAAVYVTTADMMLSPDLNLAAAVDFENAEPPHGAQTINLTNTITGQSTTIQSPIDMRFVGCFAWQNNNVLLCGIRYPYEDDSPNLGHMARVDINTGRIDVFHLDRYSFSPPSVSYSGDTVAYDVGDNQLMIWRDGESTLFDFAAYGAEFVPTQGVGSPALSPDGRQLAVIFGGSPARTIVFDLESTTATVVVSFEPIGFGGYFPAPLWNSDGTILAQQILAAERANAGLITVRPDGSNYTFYGPDYLPGLWVNPQQLLVQKLSAAGDGTVEGLIVINPVDGTQAAINAPLNGEPIALERPLTSLPELTQTFADPFARVELQVPGDWTINDVPAEIKAESGGYAVTFNSFNPNQLQGGGDGIPVGSSKFDLVIMNGDYPTLAAAVTERRLSHDNSELPLTVIAEETVSLGDGLEAVRWRLESQMAGRTTEIVTVVDGRMIILAGYGDQLLFDKISATLHLIE